MTALLPHSPCKSLMVSTNVMQLHHSNLRSLGVKTNHRKVLIICVKVTYYGCVVMNLCIKLESSLCPILTLVFCFVLFYITFGAEKHLSQQKSFTSGNKRERKQGDMWRHVETTWAEKDLIGCHILPSVFSVSWTVEVFTVDLWTRILVSTPRNTPAVLFWFLEYWEKQITAI